LQVRIGDLTELLANRRGGRYGGQALLRIVVVRLEVFGDQGVQQGRAFGRQGAALYEDFAERVRFVPHPGVHRLDQRIAADEVVLDGHDAWKQIQIGSLRGHGERSVMEEVERARL
jgi:hypothetical protein